MLREINFIIGTDKPNGSTIQDDLFKQWKPLQVFFMEEFVLNNKTGYEGYSHNPNTGILDFSDIGGIADGVLTCYCVPV